MRRFRHCWERAENSILVLFEPGTACGGEVKRELVAQVTGRVQGQVFLKSPVTVGAVIVLHELDFLGVGVVGLHGPVQELSVVGLGFGRRDLQVALGRRTQHCLGPGTSRRSVKDYERKTTHANAWLYLVNIRRFARLTQTASYIFFKSV